MGFHLFDENEEMDFILGNTYDDLQIGQLNTQFALQPQVASELEKVTEKFQVPADIALPYVLAGGTAEADTMKQIADDVAYNRAKKEAVVWEELQEKYQYEALENNMKMSIGDLLTGGLMPGGTKPGDVQYGVWAFAGLDALFQTFGPSGKWSVAASAVNKVMPGQPMVVGRSQAYLRDLKEYDDMLQKGYTKAEAQAKLQIDVSFTEVENIGKDTNLKGDIRKHLAMMKEANDMGGEAVLFNMMRQVVNGKPVNFDRGTKITLESVKAEDTPYYVDLVNNYGYTPEEARKFIYNKIGEPIKNFDENGEINYTSNVKPNQINFYAGRRKQKYFFMGDKMEQDLYKEDWTDKNILMEYSPGKVHTGQIYEPGTRQFDLASGLIDASYQIVPELLAGKGIKGVRNLRKGFTRVNKAMELSQQLGRVKKSGKLQSLSPLSVANQIAKEAAGEVDPFIGKGNFSNITNSKTGKLKSLDKVTVSKRDIYTSTRKTNKEHTFFGRVPRLFQNTKKEILNDPVMVDYWKALAATGVDDLASISTNPMLSKMHPSILNEIALEGDWRKIRKIHGDMMDTGYAIKDEAGNVNKYKLEQFYQDGRLPVRGSFVLNKLLRNTAKKGTQLQQKGGVYGNTVGTALSALGNEKAAYRSAGGYLGEKARKGRETLGKVVPFSPERRFRKLIDPNDVDGKVLDDLDSLGNNIGPQKALDKVGGPKLEFEKYLGFSSNFNSTYNPYYRKLLGFIPEQGIPLNSLQNGYTQLVSHLQINGYSQRDMSRRLKEFLDLDFNDKRSIRDFTKVQAEEDLALVAKRGGQWEYVVKATNEQFKGIEKSKIYAAGRNKKIIPNTGSGYEMYTIKAPDGSSVNMPMMTGSMFSEMSDNVAPLLDYRIIQGSMSRMFKAYDKDVEIQKVMTKNISDAWEYGKFKFNQGFGDATRVNPYEKGVISVKKLEDDMVTNMLSFYTRNVFKPLVLARLAFFTRVFLEEQARIATAGLSGLYNHPFKYVQWLASHNPNSKLAKLPFIKGAEYNDDGVQLLQSLEAMEAAKNSFKPTELIGPSSKNKRHTEYLAKSKAELTQKKYAKHMFFELMSLRNDPLARKVAEFGHGSKELNKWLASPAGRSARMDLFNYGGNKWQEIIKDGDFLDQHIQYLETRIRIKSGGNIDWQKDAIKQKGGKYRYKLETEELGNIDLRNAIAKGKLLDRNGKELDFYENADKTLSGFKLKPIMDEFEYLLSGGLDVGDVKVTRNILDEADQGSLAQIEEGLDAAFQVLFDNLMTKPIGYLNRSPVFVQYRWDYISSNFNKYSPTLQKKFIKEAQSQAVPNSTLRELKGLMATHKKGKIADYDVINVESKAFGLAMVKNLLYDTKQKHAISDKLLNIFPFAEVWFEVFQTWGKLLVENPTVLRKGHVALRGGTSADALGSSSEDGFFSPDPRNPDDDMFVLPFGGYLSSLIFGDDSNTRISPRGYVQGVNLLGQGFVPGPNPLVGFAINKLIPKHGTPFELVREQAFGDFPPPENVGDVVAVSPVYKKLYAAFVKEENFEIITDDSKEVYRMRANATNDLFRYGMASGQNKKLYKEGKLNTYLNELFPNQWTPDSVTQKQIDEAYMEYSKHKSGTLFGMQFIYQFIGPTGFKPEYFLKDEGGQLWGQAVLFEEYNRIKEENEGNDIATYNEFFELYGVEHPWLMSPKSQSETGRQPSSERVQKVQAENPEVFKQLKVSGYYLNIDNPNEEKNWNDVVYDKNLLSPDQYRRGVNDTLGFFRYKSYSRNLDALDIGYEKKTLLKRVYREQLKQALPGFQADEYGLTTPPSTKDIFNEMREKWRNIPYVMEQDTGKGFAEIMPYWEEMEQISLEYGTDTWWLTSNDSQALSMRIWMYNKAQQVIQEYPEFWGVWNGVMLKLYRDDFEVLDYIGA